MGTSTKTHVTEDTSVRALFRLDPVNTMKVFAIIALCLAAALSAEASTCTDVCGGLCTVGNTACSITLLPDFLCQLSNNVCNQVCAVGCGEIDACDTQCPPDFDTCRTAAAGNPIALAQCSITLQNCVSICFDKQIVGSISTI